MSRLFVPNRFFNTRWRRFSLFTRSDHKQSCVFFQQQLVRRTRSSSSSSSRPTSSWSFRSRHSRVWLCCGIGAGGLALALGLKYHTDDATNDGSQQCDDVAQVCDHNNSHVPASQMAAIEFSRKLLERLKAEVAAPGFVVGVSIDGSTVWRSGVGYADMENNVTCRPDTMMRIASISKPLTAAAAARLCEEGKLDLDVPVQLYVPEFPAKQFDGEDVTITSRMILSHLSGIRHYEKDGKKVREAREKAKRPLKPPSASEKKCSAESVDKPTQEDKKSKDAKPPQRKKEFENEEYYLKDNYDSVIQAMDLFKDDPLIFKPGTTFLYSTHAFTLLSAVVERAAGQRFLDHMTNMFHELGMLNTVPDENDPIIYNRSRFYHLNKKGRVVNCPYVDNSYKWAGGGFLSTVADLLLFGNAMLYSYQLAQLKDPEGFLLPGFLKPQTVLDMWSPVDKTEGSWDKEGLYAQGWLAVESLQKYGQCRRRRHYVSHTGGAVGASSVLLVLPSEEAIEPDGHVPQGVVVAIMMNMQSVGLNSAALKIAQEFEKAKGDIVTASRPQDLRQRPNIMSL